MIKKILKKILKIEQKKKDVLNTYLKIPKSSSLLHGINLDFRLEKEPRTYVTIGERCLIGGVFTFETPKGEVVIGDNVHLGNVHFICRTKIEIEDDVTMAWNIILYDHDSHSTNWDYRKNDNRQCYEDYHNYHGNNIVNKDWNNVNSKPIKICSKVWIGFDVLILKGVTVGEGAVIGAKSVVTKDVPEWTLVAGNPAKVVKHLNKPKN
jgi:galactoside O-acetyltransferase